MIRNRTAQTVIAVPELEHMTFVEMRDAAAADLREVAKLLSARADEVAQGKMDAFYSVLVEDFASWAEMLAFRQAYRAERHSTPPETVNGDA